MDHPSHFLTSAWQNVIIIHSDLRSPILFWEGIDIDERTVANFTLRGPLRDVVEVLSACAQEVSSILSNLAWHG